MRFIRVWSAVLVLTLVAPEALATDRGDAPDAKSDADPAWVEPMKRVHAKFTGKAGSFALFGDSITVSLAFWAPLRHDRGNMDQAAQEAFDLVNNHMLPECWSDWRGTEFGNEGGMTILWVRENVDAWLQKLNPETALIMFGTNDLNGVPLEEYQKATREVVQTCLDNGTVVLLSTIPPRSGMFEKSEQFAEAVRAIAKDMNVPLVDYFEAVVARRPDDWDGTMERSRRDAADDVYDVPTLISADGVHPSNPRRYAGDYSEQGLRTNGFVLRNYVTLLGYADVIRHVLRPQS